MGGALVGAVALRSRASLGLLERKSVILLATYIEGLEAAARCADAAVARFLTYGTLAELVGWFYDDSTMPGTVDWDDCVLSACWNTYTWRGVFRAWDECGRPEYDGTDWGGDDWRPELRRAAQGRSRLDAVGEMVCEAFPGAIERAAVARGWSVTVASDLGDELPEGALLMSGDSWEWECDSPYAVVLVPPAVVEVA